MTLTEIPDPVLGLVDDWLALTAVREVFTSDEVRDRLLDMRLALSI